MKNNFAITREHKEGDTTFLFVDTKKAMLRGMRWCDLGDFGKRKLENMIFLTRIDVGKDKLKIKYV